MMKEKLLEKFQDVYGDTNGTKVYFRAIPILVSISILFWFL